MKRRITIRWSYPMDFDEILQDERMDNIGIYYITRIFRGRVSDLYIGKTTYSFGSRLQKHAQNWLYQYRGRKQVRLGTIVSPRFMRESTRKRLIDDAEKTLICLMSGSLIHNQQCMHSCYPTDRLYIKNTGFRGNLDRKMFFTDEQWSA